MEQKEARYLSIAYQLAKRIANGEIEIGTKLSGRTLLSSEYQVSSETVRKAMNTLKTFGVVSVQKRSGITVLSKLAAENYIERYIAQSQDRKLIQEASEAMKELATLESKIQHLMRRFISATRTGFFPFDFFAITLDETMSHIGVTLGDLKLRETTKALVIGYEKDGIFYQNPDPSLVLEIGLVLYMLGDHVTQEKVDVYFHE